MQSMEGDRFGALLGQISDKYPLFLLSDTSAHLFAPQKRQLLAEDAL
jgi:hypothetical protein